MPLIVPLEKSSENPYNACVSGTPNPDVPPPVHYNSISVRLPAKAACAPKLQRRTRCLETPGIARSPRDIATK